MNTKRIVLALTAGAVLAVGGVAFAGPGFHGGGGMMGMRLLHLAERLNLTDEQELAAIKMRRSIREEAQQNRRELQASFDKVLAELEKPEPDVTKLHQMVDDASQRMTKVAHSSVDQYVKFHRTLTAEQRRTLVDEAKQMKEHRQRFQKERFQK